MTPEQKVKLAIETLSHLLKWSDRLGSDEIIDINNLIIKLKK